MQSTAPIEQKKIQRFLKIPTEKYQYTLDLSFSKKTLTQAHNSLLQDDHARAKDCLSLIPDPLWRDVCGDLIIMMGPASVLKIWKSTLGEFCPQDKALDFTCETEEAAAFAQQYDFVILGSLKRYFPALKQLRVHFQ
ncbi:MAG: hypothetical protein H0X26_02210 [Alphaproteobacteria bacterium]|nr:hypothetical protein [Alphaproteobacteria bacterium]